MTFLRYRHKVKSQFVYLNNRHYNDHVSEVRLREMCGVHLPVFKTYLDTWAKENYRSLHQVRVRIPPFFAFLNEVGISSLAEVTEGTVTAFVTWAYGKYRSATHDLSPLSTFFNWCRIQGIYPRESPVVPRKHVRRRIQRTGGRPYSEQEVSSIRELLESAGATRALAIFDHINRRILHSPEVDSPLDLRELLLSNSDRRRFKRMRICLLFDV